MTADSIERPVVLTFVRYYLPGYKAGGPLRTISNMVEALRDHFTFLVVTSDRDATDTCAYPMLARCGTWVDVGSAKVRYLAPTQRGLIQIAQILRETPHDFLYLNSFFDPIFTQMPLLARRLGLAPCRPATLAPRGELSHGALRLKASKKRAFLTVAKSTGLYRNLSWHASSEHEATEIRNAIGVTANEIKIGLDLPDQKSPITQPFLPRTPNTPLRVCFVSRISRKKNLDFALRILREVRSPVYFDIYGPISDLQYWEECEALIEDLPQHVTARYCGIANHEDVIGIFARYDLFFFPTQGENYGHVIFEAMSAGTPVLTSDTTPWRDLIETGTGWDFALNAPGNFTKTIDELARFPVEEQIAMRARCRASAERRRLDSAVLEANRRVFAQLHQR